MLTKGLVNNVWIVFADGLTRRLPLPLELNWEYSSVAAQNIIGHGEHFALAVSISVADVWIRIQIQFFFLSDPYSKVLNFCKVISC